MNFDTESNLNKNYKKKKNKWKKSKDSNGKHKSNDKKINWRIKLVRDFPSNRKFDKKTFTYMKIKSNKNKRKNIISGCKEESYWSQKLEINNILINLLINLWIGFL